MAQLPSGWNMIFLGGSGLFGIATFFIKSLIDGKDETISQKQETIERLQYTCGDWKDKYKLEREKANEILTSIAETLRNIDSGQLAPVEAARLKEALRVTSAYESADILQMYSDCERAAEWVENCKSDWSKSSHLIAAKKHSKFVPWIKRKKFRKEIERYLDWTCHCLYVGNSHIVELSDFVKSPVISSPYPYLAAVTHIINQGDLEGLTPNQKTYLREVLLRLREGIESRYSKS